MTPRLKILAPFVVLGLCALGAAALIKTRPTVDARPPDRTAPLVRVIEVQPQTLRLRVRTQGSVAPRTESDIIPEVSGRLVWVSDSFVSGGFFEADEPLLRIDARDYEVALERARANLERSLSQHDRAQKQLRRVKRLTDRSAASEAQLDDATNAERVARANAREARAALDQAQRDLRRTEIRAPFAGRVRDESVDVGQFVNRGAPIASLYAIDFAEVRLPIADDELAFLDLPLWYRGEIADRVAPEVELKARFAGAMHTWSGQVVRTEGAIDPRSRMVNVVARVEDPYGRSGGAERPPLAVGLFVEAEIFGRQLEDVIVVPRGAMRGSEQLLVVDAQDRLRFRSAEVVRTSRDQVVIRSGLSAGDRVVVSSISAAVDGMSVRPVTAEGNGEAS